MMHLAATTISVVFSGLCLAVRGDASHADDFHVVLPDASAGLAASDGSRIPPHVAVAYYVKGELTPNQTPRLEFTVTENGTARTYSLHAIEGDAAVSAASGTLTVDASSWADLPDVSKLSGVKDNTARRAALKAGPKIKAAFTFKGGDVSAIRASGKYDFKELGQGHVHEADRSIANAVVVAAETPTLKIGSLELEPTGARGVVQVRNLPIDGILGLSHPPHGSAPEAHFEGFYRLLDRVSDYLPVPHPRQGTIETKIGGRPVCGVARAAYPK